MHVLNDEENLKGFQSVGIPVLSEGTCVGGPQHLLTDASDHRREISREVP
jgi:hypothetical protein